MPLVGLETFSATTFSDDELGRSTISSGAESGAVSLGLSMHTPEALAAALLSLSPDDRTRLASMLTTGLKPGDDKPGE